MITELLKIAEAEVKPLVLEAQIIYTGLQLQKQLGKDNFRVVNKGIETNNLKVLDNIFSENIFKKYNIF